VEPQLSLRRLEIFRLVVEERSVTRAAAQLMIAQPAVSSHLRALEEWLGAKLFVRRGNRFMLTDAGERADVWARNVLASAAELRRGVEGIEAGTGGTVVAAASMGVGSYLLPRVLTNFRKRHPDADITLNVAQPQETLRQVESGEADFTVTTSDDDHIWPDTHVELLREEPMVIVVRSDQRPADGTMSLEEAVRLPFVGAPRVVASQRSVLKQLRRLTETEPRFVIRLGHAVSATQAVVDHGWAAILPRYVVDSDIDAGVLATVDVPGLHLQERIVLVRRRDKVFSRLQQALADAVIHELSVGPSMSTRSAAT
jgi:DNA-binding transcriptional LysR family regulator